jgi:hypothetical protein
VLLAQLVSAAPCCLALPHPATAHRALLSPGPTCQPPRARHPRPTALHCHAAAPPPAPASRGPTPAARAIPLPHQSLLFFPVPTLHTAPTPGPPASHFSLLPRARARSKGVSRRPALLSAPLLHTHAQAHRHLPRPSQNWLIDLKCQGLASPPLISPETPLPSAFIGGPLATPQSRPP